MGSLFLGSPKVFFWRNFNLVRHSGKESSSIHGPCDLASQATSPEGSLTGKGESCGSAESQHQAIPVFWAGQSRGREFKGIPGEALGGSPPALQPVGRCDRQAPEAIGLQQACRFSDGAFSQFGQLAAVGLEAQVPQTEAALHQESCWWDPTSSGPARPEESRSGSNTTRAAHGLSSQVARGVRPRGCKASSASHGLQPRAFGWLSGPWFCATRLVGAAGVGRQEPQLWGRLFQCRHDWIDFFSLGLDL